MHTHMYIETTAHAAHICTHLSNFLFFNYLSLFSFVCKIKKVCAKRWKCVQNIFLCASCVQMCASCVQRNTHVCRNLKQWFPMCYKNVCSCVQMCAVIFTCARAQEISKINNNA